MNNPKPLELLSKDTNQAHVKIVLLYWPEKREFSTHIKNVGNSDKPFYVSGYYYSLDYNGGLDALKNAITDFENRQ